jgi:hypothetical protein
MTPLTQWTRVSVAAAWRMTKKLCPLPFKIRQVQVIEEGDCYERMTHFLTGVLDPELNFLLVMLDSI